MAEIVLSESKKAERILRYGSFGNNPTSTVYLLARYYRQHENMSKKDALKNLSQFMWKNYRGYKPAIWEDRLYDAVQKATIHPLIEISYIGVTQQELDTIQYERYTRRQKLLFTLLTCAKYFNIVNRNNNDWVNISPTDLCRLSRVNFANKDERYMILNDFVSEGLISLSQRNDNTNVKVKFIDTEGEPVLKVRDMQEPGYEYMNYIGLENFKRCQECGRLIKINKYDHRTKYCDECAKYIKNEQNKVYRKESMERDEVRELPADTVVARFDYYDDYEDEPEEDAEIAEDDDEIDE